MPLGEQAMKAERYLPYFLVALWAAAGCQPGLLIDVSVTGTTEGIKRLDVIAELNGEPANGPQFVKTIPHFFIKLPDVSRGNLVLTFSGIGPDGCTIATGERRLSIDGPFQYSIDVVLMKTNLSCNLIVARVGSGREKGRIQSEPNGDFIDCGPRCQTTSQAGRKVKLIARTDRFFGGWYGKCTGHDQNRCEFTIIDGENWVGAQFLENLDCSPGGWCVDEGVPIRGVPLLAIAGSSSGDLWAIGESGTILYGTGFSWRLFTSGVVSAQLNAAWTDGIPLWAAGANGVIVRFDGRVFARVDAGTNQDLHGLWGSGSGDVWAVGAGGTILRLNGGGWAAVPSGTMEGLLGIWGSGPQDVWVVGARGTIRHWNGDSWAAVSSGTMEGLLGIWGSGPQDVWVVGARGTILHWTGTSWSPTFGTSEALSGIWGSGPRDVWAVGARGTILHWNGTSWAAVPSGTMEDLLGIWGSGPQDLWTVGRNSTILRYRR